MKNKIKTALKIILVVILILLYVAHYVEAQSVLSQPTYCCEKTIEGAYCVNAPQNQCVGNPFKSSPTSCETTSYCKLGTCYDSEEGVCMENTPQSLCEENGGTWDPRKVKEVPQCQLGCCVIADQAAFVPLVRCKKLSTSFGVELNYDSTIKNELSCIATAQAQDMGACVYEKDFERVCEFTTRKDCGAEEGVITTNTDGLSNKRTFYKDTLCSAEELNTACAKQVGTTCYKGDVYWIDSCGNRENIFSTNKQTSWNNGRTLEEDESCKPGSPGCGNCDYFQGSRCEVWSGTLGIGKPAGANHICQKTECVDRWGDKRKNGESWCVYDDNDLLGYGLDPVGSRHHREVCLDGEVIVEPCADFRNERCIMDSIQTDSGEFATAACRVNRWQDCLLQKNYEDCSNIDKRDCTWVGPVEGIHIGKLTGVGQGAGFSNPSRNQFSNPTFTGNAIAPITGNVVSSGGSGDREAGICVPFYPPGFNFWEEGNSKNTCGAASAECIVVYEEGLTGGSKIIQGEECLTQEWALKANRVCTAIGDCGGYVNMIGEYTDDGYRLSIDGKKEEFSPNSENKIKGGFNDIILREIERNNRKEARL